MLNSDGESGHSCLVPDFRGNAIYFSPLRIMFAEGLSYTDAGRDWGQEEKGTTEDEMAGWHH